MTQSWRASPILTQARQPRVAIKRIVQLVHAQGLQTGDRLPTQPELLKALGFSNDTLNAAMRILVDQGFLTRRKKSGTVLLDRDAFGPLDWTIGLATIRAARETGAPFYAELCLRVQMALADAGCRCRTYHLQTNNNPAPLGEFFGLAEDIDQQELDGLIVLAGLEDYYWQDLRARGVAVTYLPDREDVRGGAVIDHLVLAEKGVELLAAQGCRRLTAVYPYPSQPGGERFWRGFERGLTSAGLSRRPGDALYTGWLHESLITTTARRVADNLLRPEERPDGLIVSDDKVAAVLTRLLAATDYRPRMVVQTSRQQPLHFALPVIGLEVDMTELAATAVSLALAQVRNPATPDELLWIPPRLASERVRWATAASEALAASV